MACGMPDWTGLLRALVDSVRDAACAPDAEHAAILAMCEGALHRGQLSMAASICRRLLSPADVDEVLRRQFGNHVLAQSNDVARRNMETRLKALVRGPWVGIVTTNYDTLIEKAIGQWVDREVVMVSEENPRLGSVLAAPPFGGFFFVKTHGSIGGGKVVLSTEEYDRTYLASSRMRAFLSALFLRYFVVFVGCSLEDESVRIRRQLAIDFDGLIPSSYALLPDVERFRDRAGWLRDVAKIDSLFYHATDGSHRAVDEFLIQAAQCFDPATGSNPANSTRYELAQLPIDARVGQVGAVNVDLLRLVKALPGGAVDHLDLVELSRIKGLEIPPGLVELSAEERVYRMLFLVSVGFAEEQRLDDRSIRYTLLPGVSAAISQRP
jgi:SIR2-like domain